MGKIRGFGQSQEEREDKRLFAQTLFNRLMFVYFLSRKGWLTFKEDKDYLNALWKHYAAQKDETNFYSDRLYHLFFFGLNNPQSQDLNFRDSYMESIYGSVPFLNGGLFEETYQYAVLTWRLVGETKRLRAAQTEPMVSVTYHPREEWINFIDFRIKNVGAGPAWDIKFKFEPDFEYHRGKRVSELNLFQNGLKYLGPGDEHRFFLTSLTENGAEKVENPFEVRVTYRGTIGGQKIDRYVIDFSELEGIVQSGKPPLHEIADSMKDLARRLR